jgi:hypothetical protein
MRATVIALVAGLLLGTLAGWFTQGWRSDAELAQIKQQHAQALAVQQAQALADYQRMERTKNDAIQQAQQRATQNRADADRAVAAADSMRKQLAGVPARIATATRAAVDEYAATASELLTDCTAQYQRVAEQADGHANDAAMMRDAWPTSRPALTRAP